MLRFIDPYEGPLIFWEGLPARERSRRLRMFLMAIAAGEADLTAWLAAIDFEASSIRAVHELVDVENRDDARIRDMIRRDARDRWPSVAGAFTLRRQRALREMIEDWPAWDRPDPPSVPSTESLARAGLDQELWSAYRRLGGDRSVLPPGPRGWDAADAATGILVELDEEPHFNRERATTLSLPAYEHLPRFPMERYIGYCVATRPTRSTAPASADRRGRPRRRSDGSGPRTGLVSSVTLPRHAGGCERSTTTCRDLAASLGLWVARIAIWDAVAIGGTSYRLRDILDAWPDTPDGTTKEDVIVAVKDLVASSRFGL